MSLAPQSVTRSTVKKWLKKRNPNSHKGTFGHLLLVGGSAKKPGSIMLAGYAALRSGAGLATVALPDKAYIKFPKNYLELMFEPLASSRDGEFGRSAKKALASLFSRKSAIAIGPGMGLSVSAQKFLRQVIEINTGHPQPMIIDADALTLLAQDNSLLKKLSGTATLLTPHPGEMARLLHTSVPKVEVNRIAVAQQFAQKHRVYLLLKGPHTVMATPSGVVYINGTGNPGMATGGMGDVLTGIIGSLLAQGYSSEVAMVMGCWVHGRAGDRVAKKLGDRGLVARDICEEVPFVFKELLDPK